MAEYIDKVFTVTSDLIDRGTRWNPRCCPVARTLLAAGCKRVSVTIFEARFVQPGQKRLRRVKLPINLQWWMKRYDRGNRMTPVRFTLPWGREG